MGWQRVGHDLVTGQQKNTQDARAQLWVPQMTTDYSPAIVSRLLQTKKKKENKKDSFLCILPF